MQPPGWYPDPAAVPNRLRFWTGQGWHDATTYDPRTPFPAAPTGGAVGPGPGGPDGPSRRRPRWLVPGLVGVGVVVVALLVGLVVVPLLRTSLTLPNPDPPTAPAEPTGSGPAGSSGSPAAGQLNCAGSNGVVAPHRKGEPTTTTGIEITYPADWSIRYNSSQWTWLDDQAAWGRWNTQEKWAAGVAVGGLSAPNGFTTAKEAAERQVMECLRTYGGYNDPADYPDDPRRTDSKAVTQDGMSGWRTQWQVRSAAGDTEQVTIYVLDSGQPQKLATAIGFAPTDQAGLPGEIDKTLATVAKA